MPSKRRVSTDLLVHLRRARDVIDRQYAEPLNLESLGGTAGLSKFHSLRSLSTEYGQTPAQYLSHRRIEHAQDLLRATNLTVTEIYYLVGFSSLGSFSSKFREVIGISPSAYQARYAAAGAPKIAGCYVFMHGLSDRQPQGATRSLGGPGSVRGRPPVASRRAS